MAKLVIKDLPADDTLDAAAMREIAGGSALLKLVNAPNAARYGKHKPYDESTLIRGLVQTRNLRGLS
ncbi:MAG: hypothetical protein AAF993_22695 [Pseudomonadota bacterium]